MLLDSKLATCFHLMVEGGDRVKGNFVVKDRDAGENPR